MKDLLLFGFCQALRDGNKLAQMEEASLVPGESIKAIGKFNMYTFAHRDL